MSANNFIKLFKEEDGKYRGYMGFASEDDFEKGNPLFEVDDPAAAEILAGNEYTEYGWHWANWTPAQEITSLKQEAEKLRDENRGLLLERDAEIKRSRNAELRVRELEGLLSNDTAEWKSAAFQKIKGLEAQVKDLSHQIEVVQIDLIDKLEARNREYREALKAVQKFDSTLYTNATHEFRESDLLALRKKIAAALA